MKRCAADADSAFITKAVRWQGVAQAYGGTLIVFGGHMGCAGAKMGRSGRGWGGER